jgi:hypothetical protein
VPQSYIKYEERTATSVCQKSKDDLIPEISEDRVELKDTLLWNEPDKVAFVVADAMEFTFY